MNKTQQNSKYKLYDNGDKTINPMMSECSKLVQKEYKTRQQSVGKEIHWKMCKKFKSDYMNTWYKHSPEYVIENETHKLLMDFKIPTDPFISAWRVDLMIDKQKKKKNKQTKKTIAK